jgi:hypothetical protein
MMSRSGDMVTAGIGGDFYFYSARVWDDRSSKWRESVIKGGLANAIQPGKTYSITATVQSSELRLSVDGVHLGTAILPFPLVGTPIGVFSQTAGRVHFSDLRIESQQPEAFVVMPFSGPYNDLYTHVFEPVCKRCELHVHRSDRTYGPGLIISDIVQRILRSQVIIAEITPKPPNANVYFEVGFAFASRKPIILLADQQCPEPLPFDVSPFRVMFYQNTIAGKRQCELELLRHLNAILTNYPPIAREYEAIMKEADIA